MNRPSRGSCCQFEIVDEWPDDDYGDFSSGFRLWPTADGQSLRLPVDVDRDTTQVLSIYYSHNGNDGGERLTNWCHVWHYWDALSVELSEPEYDHWWLDDRTVEEVVLDHVQHSANGRGPFQRVEITSSVLTADQIRAALSTFAVHDEILVNGEPA